MAAVSLMTACGGSTGTRKSQSLSGAGATFPLPFYNVVFEEFAALQGDQVAYGGIGSGGGVRNLRDQIVDFAASDAFLSDEEMAQMPEVIHIPTCMGAVVLAFNLPGIEQLNLSGELIADIFAGKVTRWNDTRLVAMNPRLKLPNEAIIPVFRSDGSGTTFVFTDYLQKVSQEWAIRYGSGKSVNFPVGLAAKGNPGVAGLIAETAYSIGYVGSEYAFARRIPYATLVNACGEFITPTPTTISAAASGKIPDDLRASITNSKASGAYPISTFTWLLLYKEQHYAGRSLNQAQATLDLVEFILDDQAQQITSEVHYAPLPEKAIELSRKQLKSLTYDGQPLVE